jgi:polyisoprenyl-phosphate glycosyltransferase
MPDRKRITIMTPFNEELNVRELHRRTRGVMDGLPQYEYQHIFIDNASHDGTVAELRAMAAEFPEVRVIANTRSFGHLRSPVHAFLKSDGDAVGCMPPICRSRPNFSLRCSRAGEGFPIVAPCR